jgi:hypothetical protein
MIWSKWLYGAGASGALFLCLVVVLILPSLTQAEEGVRPQFQQARTFRSGSAQTVTIENSLGENIKCSESENTSGSLGAGTLGTGIVFKLKGCKKGATGCLSTGAGAEEVVTGTLKGALGYLPSAARGAEKVAFAIDKENSAGAIAVMDCGATKYELKGCLVATLARAGNPGPESGRFTLELRQSGGKPEYTNYEQTLGGGLSACSATLESGTLNPAAGVTMSQEVLITPSGAMQKIND